MKTANLLLNHNWELKICDMGLARFNTPETLDSMKKLCGTYSYLAPEVFSGEVFTVKSDVFSMAIVLWEIVVRCVTGKYKPPYLDEFPHLTADFQIAIQVAEKGLRNSIPTDCPKKLGDLIQKCWADDPSERPSTSELLANLRTIQDTLPRSGEEEQESD